MAFTTGRGFSPYFSASLAPSRAWLNSLLIRVPYQCHAADRHVWPVWDSCRVPLPSWRRDWKPFPAVHEQVLTIGGAETHPPYHPHEFFMKTMDTHPITVRSPISMTRSSICFFVFSTTPSMRAGWIRPSVTRRCRELSRATPRRRGSNEDKKNGFRRIIYYKIYTCGGFYRTDITSFLPNDLPFISSLSRLKTVIEFSIACSAAVRWIV